MYAVVIQAVGIQAVDILLIPPGLGVLPQPKPTM